MANAVLTDSSLEDRWSIMGQRHFFYGYLAANYNDTVVLCYCPKALLDAAQDMNVVVTHLTITHAGTIGMVTDYVMLGIDQNHVEYLENWTTTRAIDVKTYSGINLHICPRDMTAATPWVQVWPRAATYVATDDMNINIRGYIESNQFIGPVIPTSLEGYKWPLVRR